MKKTILISSFALAVVFANAQLKVYSGGNVAVGSTSTTPNSPLTVGVGGTGSNSLYETYTYNSQTANSTTGARVEIATPTSGNNVYSTVGYVVNGAGNSFGAVGESYNSTAQSSGQSVGLYGIAGNAQNGYNYAVWGRMLGTHNGAGVFGSDMFNTASTLGGFYAGYFAGKLYTTNDTAYKPTTSTWFHSSDKRLKTNIAPYNGGLSIIRQLNPKSFQYTGAGKLPANETHIGVLAQDVQTVIPSCIGTINMVMTQSQAAAFGNDVISSFKDSSGAQMAIVKTLTFNPHNLFFIMINAIKQLDSTVTALQAQVANCCSSNQRTMQSNSSSGAADSVSTINVQLANNAVLYQSEPNPNNGSTTIRYFIPENTTGAYIVFYDFYGKEIKKVEVTQTGAGKIEADTQNLSEGVYSYSLIVNGKIIDTKKMVKNN